MATASTTKVCLNLVFMIVAANFLLPDQLLALNGSTHSKLVDSYP